MKQIGLFVAKSVAFSALFWAVGATLFFSLYSIGQRSPTSAASDIDADMAEKYWEQAAEADHLQEMTRKQLEQSAALIEMQSKLLERWEKVIASWEQHSPK